MATKLSKINDSLVMLDDTLNHRWYDAFGDVTKYILGYGVPVDDTTGFPLSWVTTATNSSTVVNAQTRLDSLLITTDTAEYDGINMQVAGEHFQCVTSKPFVFEARLKVSDATQSDVFVGLAELDTTLLNAAASHAIAVGGDGLFFAKLDGVTTIAAYNYNAGSSVGSANVTTALDTDYHDYKIYYDGDSVHFYFDNDLVTTMTASLPDTPITPSINLRAGAAAAKTMTISWLRCIQVE